MTTTPTSGAADLRATFSEMLVDLPNTEPFTLFKAGFDAALAAGQATAAQQPHRSGCTAGTDEACVQRGCCINCPAVSPRQGVAYAALPEPLEIDWPELHSQALGCGVEDRGLHNRYECAEYGWQDGVDKCADRVPEQIFDADQMRAFADATCALRASRGQAPAGATKPTEQQILEAAFAPAQPAVEASRFGSPELQAMIIARCVEKDQADNKKKDPL